MADPSDIAALIAELEAERAELDFMIAGLRRRAGLATAEPPAAPVSPLSVTNGGGIGRDAQLIQGRVRSDEFFRLSISDAIMKFLAIMKQPQSPGAIVSGLKSGGVLTNAKNFYANVNKELGRMRERDVVVNTPSGWGLAEWYPNKPKQAETPKAKKSKKKKTGAKSATAAKKAPVSKAEGAPKAPTKTTEKPNPSGGMTWNQFSAEGLKAGRAMKDISAEWKERKAGAEGQQK
jgi:hypothetical protein